MKVKFARGEGRGEKRKFKPFSPKYKKALKEMAAVLGEETTSPVVRDWKTRKTSS